VRQGRTEATGGGFECFHVVAADRAGASRLGVQDFPQGFDFRGRNQQPVLKETTRDLSAATVMCYRLLLYVEFKTKRCAAVLGPTSEGHISDIPDDLRSLTHVIKTFAGLLVDVRRWLHHLGRMPRGWHGVTWKVRRFFRGASGAISFKRSIGHGKAGGRFRVTTAALTGAAIHGGGADRLRSLPNMKGR
jgi:hypothetical protein